MMARSRILAAALFAALSLSACDRGVDPEPARDQPALPSPDAADAGEATRTPQTQRTERASADAPADDPRTGPQPVHDDGSPVWAANRRLDAEEAAQRQFERNGRTFGADTVEEYVDQAHAFIAKPPAGVERATRSGNGDKLFYDPKSNTFLVATRDGAPRTMFKPDDGPAYWANEKQEAATGRNNRARRTGDDDRG